MFFLFGTKSKEKSIGRGEFWCPNCRARRPYQLKEIRRVGTVYFVPILPMDKQGEFVECEVCGEAFKTRVLSRTS